MWYFGVLLVATAHATLYDSFSGQPATREQIKKYAEATSTDYCITNVEPKCDPNEYRRVDGTCNNLKHPPRGAIHNPSYRVLPRYYGYTNRKTKDNEELKPARYVRTQALFTGKGSSTKFTQLSLYFLVFMLNDIGSLEDIINYTVRRTYCCAPEGELDDMCTPNLIPYNDPVHRFSSVRCMNMTRPYTFQYYKCLDNDTTPERIMPSTPLFDLSQIYNFALRSAPKIREYSDGRLRAEIVKGYEYPPSNPDTSYLRCNANRKPLETRCNEYRKKNMVRDGVITCDEGYRDVYDETIIPQMSDEYEYEYMLRYFHISQENSLHTYDKNGHYLRSYPMVNLTARTAFVVDHEAQIGRGGCRQFTGSSFDYAVDPGLADFALDGLHKSFDITMADIAKGRLFGFAPYKKYREFCAKKKYTKWEDFRDTIDKERLYRLRIIYKDIKDVELMPAVWNERPMKGAEVPPTLYCSLVEQLIRSIKSDRLWYERKNRPHAFTEGETNCSFFFKMADQIVPDNSNSNYLLNL